MPAKSTQKAKVLIVYPVVGIGDLIWVKPWIDEAVRQFNAILMVRPAVQGQVIFQEHKELDVRLLHRSQRGHENYQKGRHDGVMGFFRLVHDMRQMQVEQIWVLHRSWRYAGAAMLAGIKKRFGYGRGKQKLFLTAPSPLPPDKRRRHPREVVAMTMAARGVFPKDTHPRLAATPAQLRQAKALLPPKKPVIIMGVGSSWRHQDKRRWDAKYFAELVRWMINHYPETHIVLCGSGDEQSIGENILTHLGTHPPQLQLIFDQPLGVVMGLCQSARLYIGNDMGLLNIAAACGVRVIRILASKKFLVLDSELIETVGFENASDNINDITPEQVIAAVRPHLDAMTKAGAKAGR